MQKVLTAAEMREVDRLTAEKYGIPSILLMENAAHAAARVICDRLGGSVEKKGVLILCGKGNNGGDGVALGRILWSMGARVYVLLFGKIDDTQGDARANFEIARNLSAAQTGYFNTEHRYFRLDELDNPKDYLVRRTELIDEDVCVDAVFGSGLVRPLDDDIRMVLNLFSGRHTLKVSLDLPTGGVSDSAYPFKDEFGEEQIARPDVTVTFTAPKIANVLPPASRFGGELVTVDIGSPYRLVDDAGSQLYVSEPADAKNWLQLTSFREASYKNKRGHALIVAGSRNYSGAAVLCGNAAMRSGVGLVTLGTPRSSKDSTAGRVVPEVMVRPLKETDTGAVSEEAIEEIREFSDNVDAIAIGAGLSASHESTGRLVRRLVKERTMPTILDADALTLLSPFRSEEIRDEDKPPIIVTPHQGEFLKMLGADDPESIKDRVAAVREFAQEHHVILVLKGERALIAEPGGKVVVNPTGNSGLGKAGNGDTLLGIIAGFVAQAAAMNVDIFETVVAAVYISGLAGDIAEKKFGKRVMTASDVRECLGEAFEICDGSAAG